MHQSLFVAFLENILLPLYVEKEHQNTRIAVGHRL